MPADTSVELEESLRQAISPQRMQRHLDVFAQLHRHSGTEDEWQAARYVVATLRGSGIDAEILELDSLISSPLTGALTVLGGNAAHDPIHVRTRSFGAQTPPGGIVAELVHVPFARLEQGEMIFSHRALAGDYSGLDVAGKIVLTGDGGPDGIRRAQERGALGHVHIWPSDEHVVHEMIASSVWGTPTPESARHLPAIPVLGLNHAAGERLVARLAEGPVTVRLESNVETGWVKLPLATATIPGRDSDDFLLVGAHIDSWYEGITDNATGDVALLETARALAAHAGSLRRGVRFAWWPGHSSGRYSGSTWYADTHFRDLRERAVGYLNIDSPGIRDSTVWECRHNTGEVEQIAPAVVRELSGQDAVVRRPLRAADQSFLGVGLPSLGAFRMLPVDHPDRTSVGGCGGGYWWHSPEDTIDKADADILAADTEVYVTMAARVCVPQTLPYDFVPTAQDFRDHLLPLQEAAGQYLDLTSTIQAANDFRSTAERLSETPVSDGERRNDVLKRLSRLLNPALYTIAGPYQMDPALQLPLLPGLAPMRELAALDPSSDAYHFLLTQLRRQRNRIEDALVSATRLPLYPPSPPPSHRYSTSGSPSSLPEPSPKAIATKPRRS